MSKLRLAALATILCSASFFATGSVYAIVARWPESCNACYLKGPGGDGTGNSDACIVCCNADSCIAHDRCKVCCLNTGGEDDPYCTKPKVVPTPPAP
jgi:hypothetical protein